MEAIVGFLQRLDLHPVADHFTVALLIIAVVIDLVASLAPTRAWLRYMAVTLMILGAIAAAASYATGDMEADRVWKALGKEAKGVLHWHAELGEYLAVGFAVLAIWRILIEGIGFFTGSRPVYLLVAVAAAGFLIYQGYLGGELVYDYGVGTALLTAPSPTPMPTPAANEALPTVTVPTAMLTPAMAPTPQAAPTPQGAPTVVTPVEPPKPSGAATPAPTPG